MTHIRRLPRLERRDELGEAIGGEVFELLGPMAALVYGVVASVRLWRRRRAMDGSDGVTVEGAAA